jgi:hypothetical protein
MLTPTGLARLALLGCIVPSLLPTRISAQNPTPTPEAPPPTIRSESRAVVIDVLVTNGSNEPVSGLRQEDFEVNEDGHPQHVVFFEEHKPQSAKPADLVPTPPNVFTNVPSLPPADTTNILLLDGLHTPREEQSFVREQVIKFVNSMPPEFRWPDGTRPVRDILGGSKNKDAKCACVSCRFSLWFRFAAWQRNRACRRPAPASRGRFLCSKPNRTPWL